jgi:hypothetical protein
MLEGESSISMALPLHPSRGNALFLILIGVALFAALAYAVTQSGRSGNGSISREQTQIAAAEIVQMGAAMKAAADRMVLSGVPMTSVQLYAGTAICPNPDPSGYYPAGRVECSSGANCLFSPTGGGAQIPQLPQTINMWDSSSIVRRMCYVMVADANNGGGGMSLAGIGQDLGGTSPNLSGTDAFWSLQGITLELCQAINAGLGLTGAIPVWDGTPGGGHLINAWPGKSAGCFKVSVGASIWYQYYQALIEN